MKFYVSTTSTTKANQFKEHLESLGHEVELLRLEIPEVQSADVREVARRKAELALGLTDKRPLLVDDTGVEVEGLMGFPGALMKPVLELGGIHLLHRLCAARLEGGKIRAEIVTAIAIHDGKRCARGEGKLSGTLDFNDPARFDDEDCTGMFFLEGETTPQKLLPRTEMARVYAHRIDALDRALADR